MLVVVNPRNNLAHCFRCQKNFNNIDLLMMLGYNFASTVTILDRWLNDTSPAIQQSNIEQQVIPRHPLAVDSVSAEPTASLRPPSRQFPTIR